MNKLKILGFAATLFALTVFSACGAAAEPDKSPEEVVREGLSNLYSEVQSAKYEVEMDIQADMPEGETPEELDLNLTLSGEVDQKDPKKPKMTLKIEGDVAADGGDKEALTGEIRMTDTAMYAMLSKVPSMDGQIPMELIAPYLNQWYMMEIPPGTFDDPSMQTLFPGKELTEDQKKIKELLGSTDIIGELEYVGSEDVMGGDSYHYKGKLSKEGVMKFLEGMSDIYGGQVPTESELDEVLDAVELTAELWVGVDDSILRKVSVDMTVTPPEGGKFVMKMSYAIGNINADVTIEEPADAKGFEELMGLLFGAAMAMPEEDFDYDEEYEFDEDYEFDEAEFEAEMAELEAELEAMEIELDEDLAELDAALEDL
ncbi:hypothetical protein ACFL21_05170 [Patescibacteria group bacterium]